MRPDIGASVRYEQGNIADQPDSLGRAVSPELFPLHGELPLDELMVTYVIGKVFLRANEGVWLARS
jgi:hypothetical protein